MVNDEQGAKVLDFGVARRLDPREADALTRSVDAADTPNRPVGTLAYIAPEVLLGGVADPRSDIWALGVVLHELATGTLPFVGRNEFEITAGILRAPVPPFPAHVPPMMRGIIQRCLAKEPAQRYQRAGEVRAALEAVQSDAIPAAVPIAASRSRRPWLIGLVAVAIAALILVLSQRSRPSSWEHDAATGQLTRIVSTEYETFDPSLSPDGRMLAYAAMGPNGSIDLYSSRVAGGARLQLTNDDAREASPKFSPDGERIAFTRRDGTAPAEIRIVPTLGGDVLASIPGAAFPAWSPDGRRLAYLRRTSDGATELTTSLPNGGDPRVLMRSDSAYPFLRNPAWSPDGRLIAVVKGTGGIAGEIWLQPVDGGPGRRAIEEPSAVFSDSPVFTPDGAGIIHASNRGGATNIWMLPLAGDAPIRLTTGPGADESPSVAADRAIAFVNSRWRNTLDIRDHTDGSSRTLLTHAPFLWGPAISPNGKEVAFSRSEVDGSWHVWVIGLQGGTARQLTSGETGEIYSRYSPDGAFLLFHTWGPSRRIGRVSADGGPVTFLPLGGAGSFADVSPDGKTLVFVRPDEKSERIYTVPIDGRRRAVAHAVARQRAPLFTERRSHRVCGQSRLSRRNLRHQPRRHERAAADERRQLAGLVAGWSADCVSHGRSRRRSRDSRHHARRDDADARQGETPRDQSALRRAARRTPHRGDERGPRLGRNLAALPGAVTHRQ